MPGSWWCIRSCMDTSASPRMNSDSRRQTNASGRTTPRSWTTSPATLLSSRSHLQWRPFLSGTSYLQALQRLTLCYHARVSWRIRLISLAPPSAYYSPWRSADYPPRTRTRTGGVTNSVTWQIILANINAAEYIADCYFIDVSIWGAPIGLLASMYHRIIFYRPCSRLQLPHC